MNSVYYINGFSIVFSSLVLFGFVSGLYFIVVTKNKGEKVQKYQNVLKIKHGKRLK